jgi:hypothetical protein
MKSDIMISSNCTLEHQEGEGEEVASLEWGADCHFQHHHFLCNRCDCHYEMGHAHSLTVRVLSEICVVSLSD